MSSDTRLYPEEHEPKAIKIRHPKHTKRNIIIGIIFAVVIVMLGALGWVIFSGSELPLFSDNITQNDSSSSESELGEESSLESESQTSSESSISSSLSSVAESEASSELESEPVLPSEPETEPIPVDEWYMILVNKDNPLDESFSIETVTVDLSGHTVDKRISGDLYAMLSAAESDNISLYIATAYRSYQRQKELFESGATTAAPGTSEHNSGLAVDILTLSGEFEGSEAQSWLVEHAAEYGFILRYPKDKQDITGFSYEPWHFRYVGAEQAKLINESGLCLEEYLAQ